MFAALLQDIFFAYFVFPRELIIMPTYKVTLINEDEGLNETIEVNEYDDIISGAGDYGIELPGTCLVGCCSSCTGKITAGSVDQSEQKFLDEDQINAGFVLTCVARPTSDCTIETHKEYDLSILIGYSETIYSSPI